MKRPTTPIAPMCKAPESARAILVDPERMAALYEEYTVLGLAAAIGCSETAVKRAMAYHGIRPRPAGQRPGWKPLLPRPPKPGNGDVRAMVRLAAWRAYRRLGQCPPDCPYSERCWAGEDECKLEEEIDD